MTLPILDIPTRDYNALPESIKAMYSWSQYQWLSDDEKGRLLQTETEPEHFED